jgi:predicted MPP superfamily phosphohydrolase
LDGLTLVQLSDLHVGPFVDAGVVRNVVRMTNDLAPDVVVLTGDFVYRSAQYSPACARELRSLRARHGVYAVLGNHDVWTDANEVAGNLTDAGVTVLRNQRTAVEAGGARLWLLGLDDAGYTGRIGDSFRPFRLRWQPAAQALERLLDGLPETEPRVLLVHNPDFTEMMPAGQIDLTLCGHTHGGQVRLPLIGAPVMPSCFGQKYARGLVRNANTLVYVNRGIGMTALPVRFNCRPEITVLRL